MDAAIHSEHSVHTVPVSSSKLPAKTPVVNINGDALPLTMRFNTVSTRINAVQKHISHPGQVQKHNTVDEPDLLIQNIQKPVIQEVHEVITPMRKITQEVRPVQERIQTIIARGQDGGGSSFGGNHFDDHYGGGGSYPAHPLVY